MNNLRILTFLLAAGCASAQSFEVASIKPNASNDHRVSISIQPGGRFVATGIPVRLLIGQAYNVKDFQITNGPDWINGEAWDVNAKADSSLGDRVTPEQLRPMLQAMLKERFGLKLREESKEMPVYALMVAKGGPKLKPSESAMGGPGGQVRMGRGQVNAQGVPMAMIVRMLSQQLGRDVIDKTDLKGTYDVSLSWTPEVGQGGGPLGGPPPPDAVSGSGGGDGPTIYTALQEQLGLRLETTKGPVKVLVIESISKPTEN